MQVVQCKVEWFNHNWSEGMMKQMVLRQIKWFHLTYSCWCQNHQKYKSETDKSRLELSSLYMESDVMFFIYGPYIGMFFCQILFKKKES